MTDLPSLRETLDAHGLSAKKSFGQHFLLDLNVTRKIVRLAGPFEGRAVIEVGPGPGGLTRALLESDAGKVVLVEKDPRFVPLLTELDDGSGRSSRGVRCTTAESTRGGGVKARAGKSMTTRASHTAWLMTARRP